MVTAEGRRRLDALRLLDPSSEEPWGGRSPRVLTRGYELFSLSHEETTFETVWDDTVLDQQCRRHHYGS